MDNYLCIATVKQEKTTKTTRTCHIGNVRYTVEA
jgi:hypothetical protein